MNKIDYLQIPAVRKKYISYLEKKDSGLINLQTQWTNLRARILCKTKNRFLYPRRVKTLLLAEPEYLARIYFDFWNLFTDKDISIIKKSRRKSDEKVPDLMEKARAVFDYSKVSTEIAKFLMDYDEEYLHISTCFYCDSAYVNVIADENDQNKLRMFDVDHYIPKAYCPLTSLSLFNFVPSCQICNSRIKHEGDLFSSYGFKRDDEKAVAVIAKLCPASREYDYDNNVLIQLVPKKSAEKYWRPSINFSDDPDKYTIDFLCKDRLYNKENEFLRYSDRYNHGTVFLEALNLLDLQKRYTKTNIHYIAKILRKKNGSFISEAQIEDDIFHTSFNREKRVINSKMKTDILNKTE